MDLQPRDSPASTGCKGPSSQTMGLQAPNLYDLNVGSKARVFGYGDPLRKTQSLASWVLRAKGQGSLTAADPKELELRVLGVILG